MEEWSVQFMHSTANPTILGVKLLFFFFIADYALFIALIKLQYWYWEKKLPLKLHIINLKSKFWWKSWVGFGGFSKVVATFNHVGGSFINRLI